MATWQATNINTGTTELAKYGIYDTTELWIASLTTAWASADVVKGPIIPANSFITDLVVDVDQLDTGTTAAFEVGYTNASTSVVAAFIASGNTTARAGGVVIPNVNATYGFSPTVDSTLLLTFTGGPATAKAGKIRFKLTYNYNP